MKIENGLPSMVTAIGQGKKADSILPASTGLNFAEVLASSDAKQFETRPTADTEVPAATDAGDFKTSILSAASKSDAHAENLLGQFSSAGYDQLVDVSNWPTVRYSASGELQTPESTAYFSKVSAEAVQGRTELLNAERAKGTAAAEILDKVLAFNSELPQRFKNMASIAY